MPRRDRDARAQEIEAAAYLLMEEQAFARVGMQAIARAARASNETLYRWYGDKIGLYRALIVRNSDLVGQAMEQAQAEGGRGCALLRAVGPALLTMLLGERAAALHRAAAADASGVLGRALAELGRDFGVPRLNKVMAEAQSAGELAKQRDGVRVIPDELTEIWLSLLIGDLQARRMIGAIAPLNAAEVARRSEQALDCLTRLYPPRG
ncbi:TetR/AcrR family transcriptional regulator [Paracoccus sp. (in: a-proteobacteria)]|uniref:TetR/AcrR family transcriptional regulator n=1 Tax=Paracoccus sp. TaxID=267 RepID=UPI0035B4874A